MKINVIKELRTIIGVKNDSNYRKYESTCLDNKNNVKPIKTNVRYYGIQ